MPDSSTPDPALTAAINLLGGALAPLSDALKKIGWPGRNRSGIHRHVKAGTLPVRTEKIGGRIYVTAGAVADLLRCSTLHPPAAPEPARRRPGRPPKVTHSIDAAGVNGGAP